VGRGTPCPDILAVAIDIVAMAATWTTSIGITWLPNNEFQGSQVL
jgi:hypothetical protein